MLLLLTALHAYDGWAAHRNSDRALAVAWIMVALVAAALSLDEYGGLHERVPEVGDYGKRPVLMAIGSVFAGMIGYAIYTLARWPAQVSSAWLISLGLAAIATVPLHEYLEYAWEWPGYSATLRSVMEEGTELLGVLLVFKGCIVNTYGAGDDASPRGRRTAFPVFEALWDLRGLVIVGGFFLGFVLAALSVYLEPASLVRQQGIPAAWLGAVLFLGTALSLLRPLLQSLGGG